MFNCLLPFTSRKRSAATSSTTAILVTFSLCSSFSFLGLVTERWNEQKHDSRGREAVRNSGEHRSPPQPPCIYHHHIHCNRLGHRLLSLVFRLSFFFCFLWCCFAGRAHGCLCHKGGMWHVCGCVTEETRALKGGVLEG